MELTFAPFSIVFSSLRLLSHLSPAPILAVILTIFQSSSGNVLYDHPNNS